MAPNCHGKRNNLGAKEWPISNFHIFFQNKTHWNFWILFLKTIHQKGFFEKIKKKSWIFASVAGFSKITDNLSWKFWEIMSFSRSGQFWMNERTRNWSSGDTADIHFSRRRGGHSSNLFLDFSISMIKETLKSFLD